jgi:hypothetical protein
MSYIAPINRETELTIGRALGMAGVDKAESGGSLIVPLANTVASPSKF